MSSFFFFKFGQWLLGLCWVGWVSVLLASCFTIFVVLHSLIKDDHPLFLLPTITVRTNDATMQQLRLTRSTMQPNHFLNVDRQSFDYISDIIQAAM
ncbi:hypothetical protein WN944_028036 [Citrus x changshan-huyou]|uniref:Uncharacterized protein n=1 Tax=Citrus x changshan-huyou TaxID=2935761 RepID=A0AAP0LJS8_9ROSI